MIIRNDPPGKFTILGNPFTDKVAFKYETPVTGKMSVRLIDLSGKTIRNETQAVQTGTGYYVVSNLSHLAKGQYILELIIGNERYVEKLIKQ